MQNAYTHSEDQTTAAPFQPPQHCGDMFCTDKQNSTDFAPKPKKKMLMKPFEG